MSTAELKLNLLNKIASLNDEDLLNKIQFLLKNIDVDVNPYKLNNEQIEMINESELDYKAGRVYKNSDVFNEDEEWLKNL